MNKKSKKNIKLIISSSIMLLIALPMMLFTFNMIYQASPYDIPVDYMVSLGLILGANIYIFSMIVAIAGLSFANKPYRYKWCRNLSFFLMFIILLDFFLLRAYFTITLGPLLLLNFIYLLGSKTQFTK